jgi:hypothetical protein
VPKEHLLMTRKRFPCLSFSISILPLNNLRHAPPLPYRDMHPNEKDNDPLSLQGSWDPAPFSGVHQTWVRNSKSLDCLLGRKVGNRQFISQYLEFFAGVGVVG